MSSYSEKKTRRDRLCLQNEKFSRLLRKKPRRDMLPFRACYLRRIKIKESRRNTFQSPQNEISIKMKMDPLLIDNMRSKSEGRRKSLIPYMVPSLKDNKYITKKILCHKLKKQHQHQRQMIKKDLAKRVELLRTLSEQKFRSKVTKKNLLQKALKTLDYQSKNKKFIRPKCPVISKKFSYLKLDSNIPDLDLDKTNENELLIEGEDIRELTENKCFVLSFPKKASNYDLSKRSILANIKKWSKKGDRNI